MKTEKWAQKYLDQNFCTPKMKNYKKYNLNEIEFINFYYCFN